MASTELARNVRRIGHLDIPGGGQVMVQGDYAYVGHMEPPHGTSIIDVKDPRHPRVVSTIELDGPLSHSHKARIVGDLMIVNSEQNNRHTVRRAASLLQSFEREGKSVPPRTELAAQLKLKESDLDAVLSAAREGYRDGGFKIYDVSDRARPRLVTFVRTHGFGTHRFDMDERYAYISSEMEGYLGNILVIYDIRDPARPQEVSRWWMEGQHIAGGEKPVWNGYDNRLHHTMRSGNTLWAAVWFAGIRVVDVSDVARPRTIGAYDYHPWSPSPTHTVLPVPFSINDRQYAAVIDEQHGNVHGHARAGLWVFDVTDPTAIRPVSTFHLGERSSPWSGASGRFGAHQFQEHMEDTLLFCAWFSGGLRVIDIRDPFHPVERSHFIPEPLSGRPSPQSNDVETDSRGLVYLLDREAGFDILEFDR